MQVYNEKISICNVPDHLIVNDTIISNNKIYIIISKTWDDDNKELYCKVDEIKEDITISKVLKEIYQSEFFETPGINTNNIEGNPKTIILITLAGIIIDPSHMKNNHKKYINNIISLWNDKNIEWNKIFHDNPPVAINDISIIKLMSTKLLSQLKIDKKLWPKL
jgi:hypothetical protein